MDPVERYARDHHFQFFLDDGGEDWIANGDAHFACHYCKCFIWDKPIRPCILKNCPSCGMDLTRRVTRQFKVIGRFPEDLKDPVKRQEREQNYEAYKKAGKYVWSWGNPDNRCGWCKGLIWSRPVPLSVNVDRECPLCGPHVCTSVP